MPQKTQHNYKLSIEQKNDIYAMMKEKKTNTDILNYLKDTYDLTLSRSYIAELRRKSLFEELTVYNKDLEHKLRSKLKIDAYILHLVEKGYKIIDNNIAKIEAKNLTVKEIMMLSTVINNAHKIYLDINKDIDNRNTVQDNIKRALGL